MNNTRKIRKIIKGKPVVEGAGVHLSRVFGFHEVPEFDPFLLFDDFRSGNREAYVKGFPWHPHRGIETITYVLTGDVEHGDSLGNSGIISAGDVQWMTAGSGIIHQEMPRGDEKGLMEGFQLWANLPASRKMMAPRYRDVKRAEIPEVVLENGIWVRVVCGCVNGVSGPVRDIVIDPEYLDVAMPPGTEFVYSVKDGHTLFAYVIEGEGFFDAEKSLPVDNGNLVLFDDGEQIVVSTGNGPVRFLLVSGKPIGEPVAWRGPIVMNTQEELRIAFDEYGDGTFIKD